MAMEGTVGATDPGEPRAMTPSRKGRAVTITKGKEGDMLNIKVVTWSLALFGTITYLVCVAYGLIVPESLHMTAVLEQILPGFRWLTPVGFVVGLGEAFLYGAYAGLVFAPIYNRLWKRWASA